MKKNLLGLLAFMGIASAAVSCGCGQTGENDKKDNDMKTETRSIPEEPVFDIVTDLGTIRVKLYSATPRHRDNFAKLALDGFYDGTLFHRVIDGFMIQAGDPLTKDPSKSDLYGTGDPGYTVPAEFNPALTHKKGALAAARRGNAANPKKESSGSQFYIVQDAENCSQLDGEYTVFGETIEGMDVIDKIAAVETDRRDRPVKDIRIQSVRIVLPDGYEMQQTDSTENDAADSTSAIDSTAGKNGSDGK